MKKKLNPVMKSKPGPIMTSSEDKPLTFGEFKSHLQESLKEFYQTLIEPRFIVLEKRFDNFEGRFVEFRSETLSRFDQLYKITEDLKQEKLVIHYQLKKIDQRLERMEQRPAGSNDMSMT